MTESYKMSACSGFSTCRIQFIPNDQQRADRDYSDRSVVEVRQYDFANYALRALDIDHNKDEIFNIPLTKPEQYKRGKTNAYPDEIRSTTGNYRLWLNAASRAKFHEVLTLAFDEIKLVDTDSSHTSTTPPSTTSKLYPTLATESPKSKAVSNRNDILVDVYQLGQHIKQGHIDDAADLARKLAKKGVTLQANVRTQQKEEKAIQIRVKIDSNDKKLSTQYDEITVGVYPSTTIRELRTSFEYSENLPVSDQYVFVNGHLAHDNSTMTDLDIHSNTLFILFVILQ